MRCLLREFAWYVLITLENQDVGFSPDLFTDEKSVGWIGYVPGRCHKLKNN